MGTSGPDDPRRVPSRMTPLPADRPPRAVIGDVQPAASPGTAKASIGAPFVVTADVFGDGHDRVAAALCHRTGGNTAWSELPMEPLVNDRWQAEIHPDRLGILEYRLEAWSDTYGSWREGTVKKLAAGVDIAVEHEEGALLIDAAAAVAGGADRRRLAAAAAELARRRRPGRPEGRRGDRGHVALRRPVAGRRRPRPECDGRARPGPVQRVVRAVPPLDGGRGDRPRCRPPRHPPRRRRPAPLRRRHGVRRALPPTDPPHRDHGTEGTEQPAGRARRRRQPLGDRRGGRGPHRRPPRPRDDGRPAGARRRRCRRRHLRGPRPGVPVRTGPSLGHRAPDVVQAPARRHDQARREPAEAVRGHLPARLREP